MNFHFHFRSVTGPLLAALLLIFALGCGRSTPGSGTVPDGGGSAPASQQFVGTWKFTGTELGKQVEVTWHVRPDGTATYFLPGEVRQDGTWQYSDGVIFEQFHNGVQGQCKVEVGDINHFDLTIIDNGVPAYTGLKRHYVRQ